MVFSPQELRESAQSADPRRCHCFITQRENGYHVTCDALVSSAPQQRQAVVRAGLVCPVAWGARVVSSLVWSLGPTAVTVTTVAAAISSWALAR